ncbi:MAG: hypothetical protein AAF532_03455 [Planctomycetota bacterium]
MPRRVSHLLFDLESGDRGSVQLVVPRERGREPLPYRPEQAGQAWRDVTAGDRLIDLRTGDRRKVLAVSIYRAEGGGSAGRGGDVREVRSGRAWESGDDRPPGPEYASWRP